MREQRLYIDGAWRDGDRVETIIDRWTGEEIGTSQMGSAADVTDAVEAASAALSSGWPVLERSKVLARASAAMQSRAEEFAGLITSEMGKPISSARGEVARAVHVLALASEAARALPSEVVNLSGTEGTEGTVAFTIAEPVGVVGAITPFNFPLNLVCHKVAPALAAGCPVVLKPSEKVRLVAGLFVETMIEAGVPSGWLNLVTGSPAEIVAAMQEDPRIAVITFTGSAKIGWTLKSGSPRKRHTLELGSNTAIVVQADADLDAAADAIVASAFNASGQACISAQRVYVNRDAATEVERRVVERVRALPFGNPHLDETVVGPMVTDAAAERIMTWIGEATDAGARVLTGGRADGAVIEPTVLADAPEDTKVMAAEVFGPVVTLNAVDDLEEAIAKVNHSDFGLNLAIFTSNLKDAFEFGRRAQTGTALVNMSPSFRADEMPYGGVKDSGEGREGVPYAVAELTRKKLLVLNPR